MVVPQLNKNVGTMTVTSCPLTVTFPLTCPRFVKYEYVPLGTENMMLEYGLFDGETEQQSDMGTLEFDGSVIFRRTS